MREKQNNLLAQKFLCSPLGHILQLKLSTTSIGQNVFSVLSLYLFYQFTEEVRPLLNSSCLIQNIP